MTAAHQSDSYPSVLLPYTTNKDIGRISCSKADKICIIQAMHGGKKKEDSQSVELCRSQEKQFGEDSQIIPIQAPGKTQHILGNKHYPAPSRQCGCLLSV